MRYQYLFQYRNLKDGSLTTISSLSESKLTIDELFLRKFLDYMDSISSDVSYEGKDYYPHKISELRGDSAILFNKMEFEMISSQDNLLKSLGFGRKPSSSQSSENNS